MTDDPTTFICASVEAMPLPHVPSERGKCMACHIDIWMSPATVNGLRRIPSARVLCLPCAAKEAPIDATVTISPETAVEISNYLKQRRN
jgi:hypothetical protein